MEFPAELYKYKEFNLITDPVPVGKYELTDGKSYIEWRTNINKRRSTHFLRPIEGGPDLPMIYLSYFVKNVNAVTTEEHKKIEAYIENHKQKTNEDATYEPALRAIVFRPSSDSPHKEG